MTESDPLGLDKPKPLDRAILAPELAGQVDTPRGKAAVLSCKTPEGRDSGQRLYGISLSSFRASLNRPDTSSTGSGGGVLSELRSGPIARWFARMAMVGSLAMGTAACDTETSGTKTPHGAIHNARKAPLTTYDQVLNVDASKAQAIPWSKKRDVASNFAEIDGVRYLMVESSGVVEYVACDQLTKLFDCIVSSTPKIVQGFNEGEAPFIDESPAMWKDSNGNLQFSVGATDNFGSPNTYQGDITRNEAGDLVASNMNPLDPGFGPLNSFLMKDGVPTLLGPQGLRNMLTGAVEPVNQDFTAGPGTFDGGVAVGARNQKLTNGITVRKLIAAEGTDAIKAIEKLATDPTFLVTLDSLGNFLGEPRLISDGANGSVLVFANGEPGEEVLWIVPIPPASTPSDPDATGDASGQDATSDGFTDSADVTTPDQDVTNPDQDTTTSDAAVDDAVDDIAVAVDAVTVDVDQPKDVEETKDTVQTEDTTPDALEVSEPKDTVPPIDTSVDTQPEISEITIDASEVKVQPTVEGFKVTVGDCTLESVTPVVEGGKNGVRFEVNGSGHFNDETKCVLVGRSNGKEIIVRIWDDVDGKVNVTFKAFGDKPGDLKTGIFPSLNDFAWNKEDHAGATEEANGVVTASSGSEWVNIPRSDYTDKEGKVHKIVEVAVAADSTAVSVINPGVFVGTALPGTTTIFDVNTGKGTPKDEFYIPPMPDNGNGDVDTGKDTTPATTPPADNGGCSTNPESRPEQLTGSAAILTAAFALYAATRRRKTQQAEARNAYFQAAKRGKL